MSKNSYGDYKGDRGLIGAISRHRLSMVVALAKLEALAVKNYEAYFVGQVEIVAFPLKEHIKKLDKLIEQYQAWVRDNEK